MKLTSQIDLLDEDKLGKMDHQETDPDVDTVSPLDQPIKTIPVYLEWTQANTDPTSYKQLSPSFHPLNVKIRVDLPDRPAYVVQYNEDMVILTPEGAAYCMRKIANAILNVQSIKS